MYIDNIKIPKDRHPPMYVNECLAGLHGGVLQHRARKLYDKIFWRVYRALCELKQLAA